MSVRARIGNRILLLVTLIHGSLWLSGERGHSSKAERPCQWYIRATNLSQGME